MTLDELNAALARAAEAVEERFAPRLQRRYEAALRSSGATMERNFKAKAAAPLVAAAYVPPDEDDVMAGTEDAGEATDATRRRAAVALQTELEAAGLSFTVGGIFSEELLDRIGQRATFAADEELRNIFRGVIQEAMAEGWSVPDTAREIRTSVQSMAGHRAEALARTDLIGLANAGNHKAALMTTANREPGTTYKVWLATMDGRTRPDHADADGQTVPINEPFYVMAEPLQYPGDPSGSHENVMNCRCTTLYQDTADGEPVIRAAAQTVGSDEEEAMSTTETETTQEATREPVPWDAILVVEGAPTEDMRLIERGSLSWRDLPLTLMGMTENPEFGGHAGAEVSGRIDTIQRTGDNIASTGELTTEFGVDTLAPMIRDKTVRGVSVDLAILDYEYRNADTGEVVTIEEILFSDDEDLRVLFTVTEGVILGATVCPMQAVEQAQIAVTASADGKPMLRMTVFTPFPEQAETLTAAAAQASPWYATKPSTAAFHVTEFPGPTPLTVTEDGRVFGHIATWDTCHVGIPGVCTTAPRSASGYAYFHTGEIETEEGDFLAVGKLVYGTKHASIEASRKGAARHYDDMGKVGAIVRAHDGDFGIWVSGIADPDSAAELRINPPSGDWRRIDGSLELIAALSVPVPGFPTPRAEAGIRASADVIEVTALIASAGAIIPDALVASAMEQAGCTLPERIDGVQEIAALLD